MSFINYKFGLQLFADGGEGSGEGTSSGVGGETAAAPAAEEQLLRDKGVPPEVLNKRANRRKNSKNRAWRTPAQPQANTVAEPVEAESSGEQQAAAATAPQTEEPNNAQAPERKTFAQILEDPEYNADMQKIVSKRVKESNAAVTAMGHMASVHEMLAKKYGVATENIDYEALAKAVSDDTSFFEDEAFEKGVSPERMMELRKQEQEVKRQQQDIIARRNQQHIEGLYQQAVSLANTFPGLNLDKEMQDERFVRMTSPSGGLTVEQAYRALHWQEIQAEEQRKAAEQQAQIAREANDRISKSVQSGMRRPPEAGTQAQAPSVTTFDYKNASRKQRESFKQRIYDAAARGEKIYPGQH